MNPIRIILLGICIFTSPLLSAQHSGTYWHPGTIYLANGEAIEGMLQANLEENYVIVRHAHLTKAYNARQVEHYEIYDPVSRSYLYYYSLPHPTRIKRVHLFYKLVQDGTLKLLSRETVRMQERFDRHMHTAAMIYRPHLYRVVVEEFYVLDKKHRLTRFYSSKKEIIRLMRDHARQVEEFIGTRRLHLGNTAHLRTVFRYYHALQITQQRRYAAGNFRENIYYPGRMVDY